MIRPLNSYIPDLMASRPLGKKRALLDTNIWRYVVDNKAQTPLLQLARDGRFVVQIAPAVLYESLRLKDFSLRATVVQLMTNTCFQRLMPEAYSESTELLQEVERIRPDWLRASPKVKSFHRQRIDWIRKKGGFWTRCSRSPEQEARLVTFGEGNLMEQVRAQSHNARREMIDSNWNSNPPMDKTLASLNRPVPGWQGLPISAWRVDAWSALSRELRSQGSPYRDWIMPFVDLDSGLLDSAEWVEFWLHLTDKNALPRQWMRWAHSFAQRFRKTTSGSPGDVQLATYFLETDVVITADRALLEILEECRPYSPRELPQGKLIAGGREGVKEVLKYLERR